MLTSAFGYFSRAGLWTPIVPPMRLARAAGIKIHKCPLPALFVRDKGGFKSCRTDPGIYAQCIAPPKSFSRKRVSAGLLRSAKVSRALETTGARHPWNAIDATITRIYPKPRNVNSFTDHSPC